MPVTNPNYKPDFSKVEPDALAKALRDAGHEDLADMCERLELQFSVDLCALLHEVAGPPIPYKSRNP